MISLALGAFSWLRSSKLGQMIMMAGAVMLAIFIIYTKGQRDQRRKQRVKNLEEYIDVNQRADRTREDTARRLEGMSEEDLNDQLRDLGGLRGDGAERD